MKEKTVITYLLIIACLILPFTTTANATASKAQNFIQEVSQEAISLIKNNSDNEIMKEQQLSKLFVESVDTKWIAQFAMGNHWKSASQAQKEVYINLHKKFLINSYVPKFRSYTNQKVVFKNFYEEGKLEYLIETEIVHGDDKRISVDYRVRKNADGQYRIYDVVAEGISLIGTQRSEFSSIISKKGVDYLIKKLKAKIYS
jgi:phospholipid transport system substrate-binding protein